MKIAHPLASGIGMLAVLCTSPARADLTAQDVWQNWRDLAGQADQSVSASGESYSGGVLTLSDVTTEMDLPEGGRAAGRMSELVLTERGDGTVSLKLPDEYPMTFQSTGSEGESVEMDLVFRQTGLDLVASGTPEAIEYSFAAPALGAVVGELVSDGEAMPLRIAVSFANAQGTYGPVGAASGTVENSFAAASMALEMSASDTADGAAFDLTVTASDLESRSSGTISPFAGETDLAALIEDGAATEGRVSTGPVQFSLNVDDGQAPVSIEGGAKSGDFDMSLDGDGLRYAGGNRGVSLTLSAAAMPTPPLALEIRETRGEILMPLIPTEETKPFGLSLDLADLAFGDAVWSMIDPGGQLARDAANLEVALSGEGRWTVDISDPEAVAAAEEQNAAPGEIRSLSLDTLALSFLGASLTGSGSFAFDNSAVPPAPSGTVTLQMDNLGAALSRLVAAGLLSQEQAGAFLLFAGLYARPGPEDDTLVSTIEVREDGSVLANGQRIR